MSESRDTTECENAASFERLRQALLPLFARAGVEGTAEEPRALHHLQWERHKGFVLRVTVTLNRKQIGKRVKFRLKTRDRRQAEYGRDLLLSALKTLGLTVKLRLQRPQGMGKRRKGGEVPSDR